MNKPSKEEILKDLFIHLKVLRSSQYKLNKIAEAAIDMQNFHKDGRLYAIYDRARFKHPLCFECITPYDFTQVRDARLEMIEKRVMSFIKTNLSKKG